MRASMEQTSSELIMADDIGLLVTRHVFALDEPAVVGHLSLL